MIYASFGIINEFSSKSPPTPESSPNRHYTSSPGSHSSIQHGGPSYANSNASPISLHDLVIVDSAVPLLEWTTANSPIGSPASNFALTSTLLNQFPPKGGSGLSSFEYLVREAPRSHTLLLAARSLHHLIIGNANNDPNLLQQARIYYGEALCNLQRQMAKSKLQPGHLLSAVFLFLKAEQFSIIGTNSNGWRRHIKGLLCAAEVCNKNIEEHKDSTSLLIAAINYFALWDGLLSRKRMARLENLYPPGSALCSTTVFTSIAVQVPGILEISDLICDIGRNASSKAVMDHISRLSSLEGQLHSWIHSWYNDISGLPYWISRDNEVIECLKTKVESCPQNTYAFQSKQIAQQHTTYWMCLLELQQAHLDVIKAVRADQYPLRSPDLRKRIIRDAGESADSITMSIPYLIQKEHGYYGLMNAIAPLQMAYTWYRSMNDPQLMAFCQGLAEHIQSFGLNCDWSKW